MAAFTQVAHVSQIVSGSGKAVEVDGKTIAVFNCGGAFYATDNTCPHRGGPLSEGSLSGTTVTCPWHGREFDIASGTFPINPSVSVQRFDVKVDGNDVLVAVSDEAKLPQGSFAS